MSTNNGSKYEEYLNSLKTNANDIYDQTVKNAERNRQRAVLEAGNQYNSSRAISGANAEALSQMGLTGSGYSRYLDSQAYAQKQGAINSAYQNEQSAVNQAQAAKDTAYLTAEGLYADYLAQREANKQTAYNDIYGKLSTYSFNDIERLGTEFGLDAPQIEALKAAKNELTYASLLGTEYGEGTLANLRDIGQIDQPTYEKLLANTSKLTDADASNLFIDESGKPLDYAKAKAELDNIVNSGRADADTIATLQKKFADTYTIKPLTGITFKKDGGLRDRPGTKGNNIKLEDDNGKVYRVQYSGEKGDATVKSLAGDLDSGDVFTYRGVMYLKYSDGECYEIEARPFNSNYTDLVKELKK